MPRFTQADIVRAIHGFEAAGLRAGKVCIHPDGTIEVVAAGQDDTGADEEDWRIGSPLYEPIHKEPDDPHAFTVSSLADRWQCSDGLVRNMIKRGELQCFRYGNLIRISREAVEEVEARRQPRQSRPSGS